MSSNDRVFIGGLFLVVIILQLLLFESISDDLITSQNCPPIVYQADSYGGQIGKVMAKEKEGDSYYVEIKGYGRFLITKEQFDSIVVGEDAPKEIMQRGS